MGCDGNVSDAGDVRGSPISHKVEVHSHMSALLSNKHQDTRRIDEGNQVDR